MAAASPKSASHRWSFYRAGGVDQVRLDKGADILNLRSLDQKLWVALSCPTKGLEIEERTLELLDTDGDGRVRPPEILAAIDWLRDALRDPDALVRGLDGVELANIRQDTEEGRAIFASAQRILIALGKQAGVVTVADTQALGGALANAKLNGDGVLPPESIEDEAVRALAADVVATLGGVDDRSGKKGADQAKLDAFLDACRAYEAWSAEGEKLEAADRFGADGAAAHAAFAAVRAKIDDYFGRCRLASFDQRSLAAVNRDPASYEAVAANALSLDASEVAGFPLALAEAGKPLPLGEGINPAWRGAIAKFRAACRVDGESLSESDWTSLRDSFAAREGWLAKKAGAEVETLGRRRVREILAGGAPDALRAMIEEDLSVAAELGAVERVEKLARLCRDLHKLLTNYVNFADFYAQKGAIFQAGTLFLDGRGCDMCFHVADAARHAKMAPMSNSFLAYVDCARPGGKKMSVVCAITAGDSDNLFEGRNGIFYDRKGECWDATIAKIVANPISVAQAFWSPYKRLLRGIQEAVAKKAAMEDAAVTAKLEAGAAAAAEAGKAPAPPPKSKFDVGTIAALGVAVSGIAGVFTALLTGFLSLGAWIPLGVVGLLLAISGPSMFVAWLKLRTRNLGPILDANGWAVNTLTRVNIPLGGSLTSMPKIPAGANRTLVDPYAPKRSAIPGVLTFLLVVAAVLYALYQTNLLHQWLPDYVPAHHAELSLAAGATSGAPGDSIAFEVKSTATSLQVTDATKREAPAALEPLPVQAGKATLKIPDDAAPGTWIVTDAVAGSSVEIEIAAKTP